MKSRSILSRLPGAYARRAALWFGRRPFTLRSQAPIITFTFDDYPRSALFTGGKLLEEAGIHGTYFIAHGLADTIGPTGEIFHADDLTQISSRGHEFGCHTYHHHPAWETPPPRYLASVEENRRAHAALTEGGRLQSHSFPISYPRPRTKKLLSHRFRACRGGGQTSNSGTVDLNYLKSFFLEQSRDNWQAVEGAIARNTDINGWLIFSTHDVCAQPTRFGVTPEFFAKTVQCAVNSGAEIVPMSVALDRLRVASDS